MTDRATHPSADLFDRGLDAFGAVIVQLSPGDWDHASACEGWTALDVLGHLGNSIRMGTSFLRGEQPSIPDADRPADLVEGDPVAWWQPIAAEARAALATADLDLEMDTPMGRRSVADRLAFPAMDLWVHAWDIGHPLGIEAEIPAELEEFSHHHIDPFPVEVVRGPQGAFGPEVEPPADATLTERYMAWTGRDPRG